MKRNLISNLSLVISISLLTMNHAIGSNEILTLTGAGNGFTDQTVVYFFPNATPAFDPSYDAYKLFGTDMNLYSKAGSDYLSINGLPPLTDSVIVPVGFSISTGGSYTITADGIGTFDPTSSIYLEDLQTSTLHDLRQNPVYSFTSSPSDNPDRFQLRFTAPVPGPVLLIHGGGTIFKLYSGTVLDIAGIVNQGTIDNSGTINDTGDWDNTGTAEVAGTVKFTGAATKSVSGNTTFTDVLEIDGAGATTITGGNTRVMGTLLLTSGTLNANGFLTIGSDAGGTGRIDGSGTGSTTGNITCERYVTTSNAGWRYFHTPVNGATGAEFTDDVTLSATSFGGTINSNPYPDLFYYDETNASPNRLQGWTTLTGSGDALGQGQGFILQMPGLTTVDITGTYDHLAGSRVFTGTHSNNGVSSDGWNLQGNPHPSAIDWNALAKSNMDNALYIWKSTGAYSGSYTSYVNGFGSNGGTNQIASMQAFFVHVSTPGTGTLTSDNSDRIATDPTFLRRGATEAVTLTGAGNGVTDQTVVYFDPNATAGFDPSYDAYKLFGSDMNIYSVAGTDFISINGMPPLTDDVIIPINFSISSSGTYTITASAIETFAATSFVYLEDLQTSTLQDLRQDSVYSFTSNPSDDPARFQLRFEVIEPVGIDNILIPGVNIFSYNDKVILEFENFNNTKALVEVFDLLGQAVINPVNVNAGNSRYELSLGHLSTANYIVKVKGNKGLFTEKVFISAK